MDFRWFNVIGIGFDIIGAIVLSYGLFVNKEEAIQLGGSYLMGETDEENLDLLPVKDRLKQSKNAKIGLFFLVLGFFFQLMGNWPR